MKKLIFAATCFATALFAPLACNVDQLTAENVMVATILSTPDVAIDPFAFAGFTFDTDGGCGSFDGGSDGGVSGCIPSDAGSFDAGAFDASIPGDGGLLGLDDAGRVVVSGQTAAVLFIGQRPAGLSDPPAPIDGAKASVAPEGGAVTNLKEVGGGTHQLTSLDDGTFKYIDNVTYRFIANVGGVDHVGKVTKAPGRENIPEFHPAKGFIDHAKGANFKFLRPEPPAGEERNLGFVTVFPVNNKGEKGDVTYTDLPSDPFAFLKAIALPAEWKTTEVVVPGDKAFPNAATTYVLVFQSVKIGGPESDNLFTGSAILAGTADIAVLKVP